MQVKLCPIPSPAVLQLHLLVHGRNFLIWVLCSKPPSESQTKMMAYFQTTGKFAPQALWLLKMSCSSCSSAVPVLAAAVGLIQCIEELMAQRQLADVRPLLIVMTLIVAYYENVLKQRPCCIPLNTKHLPKWAGFCAACRKPARNCMGWQKAPSHGLES